MPEPVYGEVLAANAAYAGAFDKGDLALPPARGFAILTCMDARLPYPRLVHLRREILAILGHAA